MAKLSASLPEGDRNGLDQLDSALVDQPHKMHVALVVVNCKSVTTDVDTGNIVPTARILRVDPILAEDYQRAEQLMRRALEKRNGGATLPIDVEDDVREIFKELNLEVPDDE